MGLIDSTTYEVERPIATNVYSLLERAHNRYTSTNWNRLGLDTRMQSGGSWLEAAFKFCGTNVGKGRRPDEKSHS